MFYKKDGPYVEYSTYKINQTECGLYCDGIREGLWLFYDEDNVLTHSYTYKEGIFHGPYYRYYKNGKTMVSGQYNHGIKVGEWSKFDIINTLHFKVDRDANGNILEIIDGIKFHLKAAYDEEGRIIYYKDSNGNWFDKKYFKNYTSFSIDDYIKRTIPEINKYL